MDGWRHKEFEDMQVLSVAVKTTLRQTRVKIHRHTDTVSRTNSWALTEVSTCPVLYFFIGHFMHDRRDAAKFGAPTDKQQGKESCFCQWVRGRVRQGWDGRCCLWQRQGCQFGEETPKPIHSLISKEWKVLNSCVVNTLIIHYIVEKAIKPFNLAHNVELIIYIFKSVTACVAASACQHSHNVGTGRLSLSIFRLLFLYTMCL